MDAVRTLGLNPSHALQHPGHYYYMAARCTEARRERFLASEGASQGANAAPGYANEKKVDHLTIVLEVSVIFGPRVRWVDVAFVLGGSSTRNHTSCSKSTVRRQVRGD